MNISILILAAGNSSRLGQPKQLVEFEGQTLIERITQTALSVSEEVLVVLGANMGLIKLKLSVFSNQISIIENPDWQQGMGTSISVGVENLAQKSDGIIILLSDQPFISQVLLQNMVQTFAEKKYPIVACDYGNQLGVPILFDKSFFTELKNLQGEQGAKIFLKKYSNKISSIEFKDGFFDIDTPEDLQKLKSFTNKYTEE
ncbi:MAG: nucleotidyltransferase family protein [Arcicella sp.]|nr:nucleotidyltransferase family protein [Arcicella sp.]